MVAVGQVPGATLLEFYCPAVYSFLFLFSSSIWGTIRYRPCSSVLVGNSNSGREDGRTGVSIIWVAGESVADGR